jgi:hypothetical protein
MELLTHRKYGDMVFLYVTLELATWWSNLCGPSLTTRFLLYVPSSRFPPPLEGHATLDV